MTNHESGNRVIAESAGYKLITDFPPNVYQKGNKRLTYGAIRRRRLLALKLRRSTKFEYSRMFLRNTKPPLLYSTC